MKIFVLFAVLLSMLVAFTGQAQAAAPGAIFSCQATGQIDNIDPIVSPGVYPSAHPHLFFGAHPIATTETSADLRSKPTSCAETGNHSGYWMPPLEENGVRLKSGTTSSGGGKHLLVYYRCRHSAAVCKTIQPFPENFGQVAGNSHAVNAADNPAFANGLGGYRCGTGGGAFSPVPPATCDGVLVASVTYGNCILPDGSVSMAINNACTDHGGRPIFRVQQYFRYWHGSGPVGNITIGGLPAYQLHADALFGWNTSTFADFISKCATVDCGTNPSLAP